MNATTIDLRDFPADVQDLLRQRAIEQRRPIQEVIADFTKEVSREITAVAGEPKPETPNAA